MRSTMFPHVKLCSLALCAVIAGSAMAAPPVTAKSQAILNDDLRVGAPAVIVTPPVARSVVRPAVAVATPPSTVPPVPVVVASTPPAPVAVAPKAVAVQAVSLKAAPPTPVAPPRLATPLAQQALAPQVSPPSSRPVPAMLPQAASLARGQEDRRGPGPVGATYHRPEYGYQIPAEWTASENFITDADSYDLPRAAAGFGWSRYYDDAVLTDQWGRVYDWREDVNWADHDTRYTEDRDRKSRGKRADYNGRWTGSWGGGPVQTYRGEWRGTVRPHWRAGYGAGSYGGNSGSSYGYDSGGTTVTTVIIQAAAPVMTTQTISYDEVSYVPVRAKVVRRWKPRPKPVCVCGN